MKLENIITKEINLKGIECDLETKVKLICRIKDKILKLQKIPSIIDLDKSYRDFQVVSNHSKRFIVLVKDDCDFKSAFDQDNASLLNDSMCFTNVQLYISYDFYSCTDLLHIFGLLFKFPPVSSFENIGNVIHLNLNEEHLSFGYFIGKILFDKTDSRVIYKIGKIHGVFRNYEFEVVGSPDIDYSNFDKYIKVDELVDGFKNSSIINTSDIDPTTEEQMLQDKFNNSDSKRIYILNKQFSYKINETITITQANIDYEYLGGLMNKYLDFENKYMIKAETLSTIHIENGLRFFIDLKNVYWCSRLQSERLKLSKMLKKADYVCDLFCGVGPFSILSLSRGCFVYSNDLNDKAISCLKKNVDLNNLDSGMINVFNHDANSFLQLVENIKFDHFIINLPEHSLEYIRPLFKFKAPFYIHCYFFCTDNDDVVKFVNEKTGIFITKDKISLVRKVSPTKNFYKLGLRIEGDSFENFSDL